MFITAALKYVNQLPNDRDDKRKKVGLVWKSFVDTLGVLWEVNEGFLWLICDRENNFITATK